MVTDTTFCIVSNRIVSHQLLDAVLPFQRNSVLWKTDDSKVHLHVSVGIEPQRLGADAAVVTYTLHVPLILRFLCVRDELHNCKRKEVEP